MSNAPFPIDPALTAIAIAYHNQLFIADAVLPRVPVGRQEFKWWKYPIEETFRLPDTHVGRRSEPNLIDLTASQQTSSTEDYGLDDLVPNDDINNAAEGYDPLGRATMQLTDYVELGREKRTADLVFDAAQYPASNKETLTSTDQWSDYEGSNPIAAITEALDACLMRPNIAVMGQAVWTKLSQHPAIVKAVHGNSGDSGIARRQQVADLFELEEILVGVSRYNTARPGQTASLSRVWGNHCALLYRNRLADTRSGMTFGLTAQWQTRVSGQLPEPKIGLRGSTRVRSGESVKELIVAGQTGFLFTDAIG